MSNKHLIFRQVNPDDEFYTYRKDIDFQLKYYRDYFNNKIIFLPCDDPAKSNFYAYFRDNFSKLGLKKVIATYYNGGAATYTRILTSDGYNDVLNPDCGDFLGNYAKNLYKKVDIVVTNPPFSKINDFLATLWQLKTKFILIAPLLCLSYVKSKMPVHLAKNELHYASFSNSKSMKFYKDNICKSSNSIWITTLNIYPKHPFYQSNPKNKTKIVQQSARPIQCSDENRQYINDEIAKGRVLYCKLTQDIPVKTDKILAVPISFISKYNEHQFQILGSIAPVVDNKEKFRRLLIRYRHS